MLWVRRYKVLPSGGLRANIRLGKIVPVNMLIVHKYRYNQQSVLPLGRHKLLVANIRLG